MTRQPHDFVMRRYRDLILVAVALFFLFGLIRAEAQDGSAFLIDGEPATAMHTEVSMRVFGMVAEVDVRQQFANVGDATADGVYQFPLPDDAAVNRLVMLIGDRRIEGEIQEKEAARATYEAARSAGQAASLVSQDRPDLFTARVANILPGETIAVELSYVQTVRYRDNAFTLRFPLARQPRFGEEPAAIDDQTSDVTLQIELNPGFDLARLDSRYHEVEVESRADHQRFIALRERSISREHDFELVWEPTLRATPQAALFAQRFEDQDYALMMLLPPDPEYPALNPRELILVIDTSGSMEGPSIAQARQSLVTAVAALRQGDRFNIIEFNSQPAALFDVAVDASAANVGHAIAWIESLDANGGTHMLPALQMALNDQPQAGFVRQVVFATDGAISNQQALLQYIEESVGANRLFTIGIGAAPNAFFMRKAAQLGRGSFSLIGSTDEVAEKMDRLLTRLEHPAITDVCMRWPGGAEAHPNPLPDLYHGEPIVVVARVDSLAGKAQACGKREQTDWSMDLALDLQQQGFAVASLWGQRRIESLMDDLRRGAEREPIRAEIVATALRHRLASEFTSFVAVDKTPRPAPVLRPDAPTTAMNLAALRTDAGTVFRITMGLMLLGLGLIFAARLRDEV